MTPLFTKLNLKAQTTIVVLDAPASFEPELSALTGVTVLRGIPEGEPVGFAIAFARTQARLDALSAQLADAAPGDAALWFAYPKGTSRNFRCEFNRDRGWSVLAAHGFEGVRQVSIDEDWSALRFRRVAFIRIRTPSS